MDKHTEESRTKYDQKSSLEPSDQASFKIHKETMLLKNKNKPNKPKNLGHSQQTKSTFFKISNRVLVNFKERVKNV